MRESLRSKENSYNNQSLLKEDIIVDPETNIKYKKGKKLGGGGFGEVFEFIDIKTNEKRAAKMIPNNRIENDPELNIAYNNENKFNSHLDFQYLCKCYSNFKDNRNAYFILEYQPNKTLSELLNKRKLSEIEIKHYCFELLLAIEYLHKANIIHRDIKLSNILLSEKMEVRLCDFGLAIENGAEGQKNRCGTPNYIAPELLNPKSGLNYSFEIDIWAFGVILYTLHYRKTPFEQEVKEKTKYKIQNVIYNFPKEVAISKQAKDLITSILVKDPAKRPKIEQIKGSPFFKNGEGIPKYLPASTLTTAMSQEEEENFVNNAIINGECLDKEVNLVNKIPGFSMKTKYYKKVNNEQNELESNESQSDSSSNEEDNSDDDINNKNNNEILKEEKINENNNIQNEDNKNMEENKNEIIIFNKDNGEFNSFSNNEEKLNSSSREEKYKNGKTPISLHPSTKNDLNIYYNNNNNNNNSKSIGKMNETAGFISNNLSSGNSENFSPGKIMKEKDSSNAIKEETKLKDAEEKNKTKSPKFKFKNINKSREKKDNKIRKEKYKNINENNKNENNIKATFPIKEAYDILINKYIDLSDKCGMGYILTNGDVGAYFNDGTKMVRIKSTLNIIYINEHDNIIFINLKNKNKGDYETKINALLLFNKNFIKNSKNRNSFHLDPNNHKKNTDLYLKKWIKSQHAYFFLLSNEKVQVMFNDKTQIIFDFKNKNVTFINKSQQKITQNLNQIKRNDEEMYKRVKYARKVLEKYN